MVQYLITLVKDILEEIKGPTPSARLQILIKAVAHETLSLETLDFLPAVQCDFARARQEFQVLSKRTEFSTSVYQNMRHPTEQLLRALEGFGGVGSRVVSKSFTFIKDAALRATVERDYREISIILFPGGAWKSVVVMAGGVLEALLHDRLTATAARTLAAESSIRTPKDKTGKVLPLKDGWKLKTYVDVSEAIGELPADRCKVIDQSLRDYRNLVHPTKELRTGRSCGEAEAFLAMGALGVVVDQFASHP